MDRALETPVLGPWQLDRNLGNSMFLLLSGSDRWVHRKVEHVAFLNESFVTRRVTVDFTLPPHAQADSEEAAYVPLGLLKKAPPFENFDSNLEDGTTVPILTRAQSDYVSWCVLAAAVEAVTGRPATDQVLKVLKEIAETDAITPSEAFAEFRKLPERGALEDPVFQMLLADLAASFILMAVLPANSDKRRVVKYSYVEAIAVRSMRGSAKVFGLLAWRARRFRFLVPGIGQGASYHFECRSPEGLVVCRGRLAAEFKDVSMKDEVPKPHATVPPNREWIHLYLRNCSRFAAGAAQVELQPPRAGLIRRAFLIAGFNAVLMTLGAVFFPHVSERVKGQSVDAGVAVLLVAASLVTAYVARPGENRLTSTMLFGVRLVTFLSGLVIYVAAVTLIVGPGGDWGLRVWSAFAVLEVLYAGLLTRSFYSTREV